MKHQMIKSIPLALLAMLANIGASKAVAQQQVQPTFPSAAEASQSLFQAVQSNNEQAIANILGAQTDLTSSRDPGQDKVDREVFVQKYQEMHRMHRESNGSVTLYLGAENWPFPIPIIEKNKAWRFDSDAGTKEVLFRRIGENELTAITMCRQFVDRAKEYRTKSNPVLPEDDSAGGNPVLFHGYYYRELPAAPGNASSRGFAMIAYPAEYRSSGVMTFIVTSNGVVYEKDIGPHTSSVASAMAGFHKDATWRAADK